MLKTFTFTLLCASALAAQTVPDPPKLPACLSGPVTQGSVTMACSIIDNTFYNGGIAPGILVASGPYVFQVRLTSTDPDVVGFRVGVTYTDPGFTSADGFLLPQTSWGLTGKTVDADLVSAAKAHGSTYAMPTTPGYRYAFVISAYSPTFTGIQVQELKASSSQTF